MTTRINLELLCTQIDNRMVQPALVSSSPVTAWFGLGYKQPAQSTLVLLRQAVRHLGAFVYYCSISLLSGSSMLFDFVVHLLCCPSHVSRLLVVGGCDFVVKKNTSVMDDCVVAVYPCMLELILSQCQ
jgi:hypothetical protein